MIRNPYAAPFRLLVSSCLCLAALAGPASSQGNPNPVGGVGLFPRWDTGRYHPGDANYKTLPYIVLFAANDGHYDPNTQLPVHLGTDVIASGNPAPGGGYGGLYAALPNGRVVKVFPRREHEAIPGLIDTPLGGLHKSAVVEPNISEDGKRVYFGYFHDQTWRPNGGGWQQKELSYKGADLYSIDLTPLINDHSFDPGQLTAKRLTFKEYNGPPKSNTTQTSASKNEYALNPGLATQGYGRIDMHMIEMRTPTGLKAVWVSDRSRLQNSNFPADKPNINFNLFTADILPDGSLGHAHQFQYYTTTSALSPVNLRNGFTFSYESSTEAFRKWDLQALTSTGVWSPLLGYGLPSELFHFGTLISIPDGKGSFKDSFIGIEYYNLNDAGSGRMHIIDMDVAGINQFVPLQFGYGPRPLSQFVTPTVSVRDLPSERIPVNGELRYIGKFTTPRAGRQGGEYLMAWTPTSANRWITDEEGRTGIFDFQIMYRSNTAPFAPWDDVDVAAGEGQQIVVDETSGRFNLLWPTPVLSWQERYGSPQQDYSETAIDPNSYVQPGEPYAQIGTSAIWNTDIRPYDCWFGPGNTPYNPNDLSNNEEQQFDQAFESLRYVQNQNDFCEFLLPSTVLAIQINMTSNRIDRTTLFNPAFNTDSTRLTAGLGMKEATEILGLYAPSEENDADTSFIARIPADVPFDFHLIDREYGMKLLDVRSWHSMQPRESRTDCGGCHNHLEGGGIPFAGTEASTRVPMDMTNETKFVAYDADCRPTIQTTSDPTVRVPEWVNDIWPEFDQHCSSCHDSTQSSNMNALAALDYSDEEEAWETMRQRRYIGTIMGALGSPAFWAAYGERTDGRDNDLPQYQPNYPAGEWGFKFSAIHATNPGLCSTQNPAYADWVHRFGQWIDNHMPRNTGNTSRDYHSDRYHPTVDFAYTGVPGQIRVGWWDNVNSTDIEVRVNGTLTLSQLDQANGTLEISDNGLVASDLIQVIVKDPTGNRQIKEKTIQDLLDE